MNPPKCPNCGIVIPSNSHICPQCVTRETDFFPEPNDFIQPSLKAPEYRFTHFEAQEFWMGSPEDESGRDADEHHHLVRLSHGFGIGNTEISQALYRAIMRHNPAGFTGDHRPVEQVSWYDAIAFCNHYSICHQRQPAYTFDPHNPKQIYWNKQHNGYRLPTEAEWELAAKMALGENEPTTQAWYAASAHLETHGVGQWRKSGLSDMAGNVWEWCWDIYGPYDTDNPAIDPSGPETGPYRVARGGSWADEARIIRPANRAESPPDRKSSSIGFRIAYSLF